MMNWLGFDRTARETARAVYWVPRTAALDLCSHRSCQAIAFDDDDGARGGAPLGGALRRRRGREGGGRRRRQAVPPLSARRPPPAGGLLRVHIEVPRRGEDTEAALRARVPPGLRRPVAGAVPADDVPALPPARRRRWRHGGGRR